MDPKDKDNIVLCPSCNKIFCMVYLPSHKCPYCGGYFDPRDTMAGYPMKNISDQMEYAKFLQKQREGN